MQSPYTLGDYGTGSACRAAPLPAARHSALEPSYLQRTNTRFGFNVHVTVHRVKFLIIKPTRWTNFSNLFLEWNSTCFGQFLCPSSGVFHCTHSNGTCHTGSLTACEQDQDGTDPAHKRSANLYDIYHCCVYSEKLLMMDRGTVRNMQSFIPRINLRN